MQSVLLASQTDFEGFRRVARGLLAGGVPPHAVAWRVVGNADGDDLFAAPGDSVPGEGASAGASLAADGAAGTDTALDTDAFAEARGPAPAPTVPSAFVALCAQAVLHADPDRFALLYRLLWRLVHEPALRLDPLDPDRVRAARMAQAVRRELHKMHAFVRFRPVGGAVTDAIGTLHVAWFEPVCHVVEAAAPFFARRFATLRWVILTPGRSVRWEGDRLDFGPGARRADAPPADAGEALWLTYYASIFNPARPKPVAMQKEMPRRYWPNLPEARLIAPLTAAAHARSQAMLERPATGPRRRIPGWVETGRGEGATSASAGAVVAAVMAPAAPACATVDTADAVAGFQPPRADGNDLPPSWPTVADGAQATKLPLPSSFAQAFAPDAPSADRAAALAALHDGVSRCRVCPLGGCATQAVPGEGPLSAPLMLVGEQPGDHEDLRGRPFVGRPAGCSTARSPTWAGRASVST